MQRDDGKEFAGEYEIMQSIVIGTKRFVLGRNDKLPEPYMVAGYRTKYHDLLSEYYDVGVSDQYMEILGEYIQRQQEAYRELVEQREARGSDGTVFTTEDCLPNPNDQVLTGQIVVTDAATLAPEFRTKEEQLSYVTGGNGAQPNSYGTKVYVRDCWTGEQYYIRRPEILGIIRPERAPEWAKENAMRFAEEAKQSLQMDDLER